MAKLARSAPNVAGAGVSDFVIKISSQKLVYYPGQKVEGSVSVTIEEGNEGSDLIIKLRGKSMCGFVGRTGKHGRGKDAHTKEYGKQHILVEHQKVVPSPATGKQQVEFEFDLPAHAPSSLEAQFGNIRYKVTAQIGDHEVSQPITVNEVIDPNLPEHAAGSSGEAVETVNSCFCLAHGDVDMKARTDRGAYCPGESIRLTVDIANEARKDMKSLKAALLQTMHFKTNERTKRVQSVVADIRGPKIKKGDSHVWEEQPLGIPAIPPTISDVVVAVEYHVKLSLGVSFGGDLSLLLPITIATLPYADEKPVEKYGTTEQREAPPASDIVAAPSGSSDADVPVPVKSRKYSRPVLLKEKEGESNSAFVGEAGGEKHQPVYMFACAESAE